jgi:hypothetical protein
MTRLLNVLAVATKPKQRFSGDGLGVSYLKNVHVTECSHNEGDSHEVDSNRITVCVWG